jgi:predicted phage baseplate assembly protein
VRWHRVQNFHSSDARSRHYVLDRITGMVTFGNGQQGMLPPIGRDNIRAFVYRAGGGRVANTDAKVGVVKELRTSLPFVDSVSNVVAASGGSDAETVNDALERGPQTIKNRNRAVTTEDYVWLAQQSSTLVHRVKCLPTTRPTANQQVQFDPGSVTLLLVPESEDPQPRPSQQLIRQVRDELLARSLSVLKPQIFVIPPTYIDVRVRAEVIPLVLEEASVVEGRIDNRLRTFLHAVQGGPEGEGWEFGRHVYISEIYQVIEDIEGVDVVLSVILNDNASLEEVEIGDNELPSSGVHDIVMTTGDSNA